MPKPLPPVYTAVIGACFLVVAGFIGTAFVAGDPPAKPVWGSVAVVALVIGGVITRIASQQAQRTRRINEAMSDDPDGAGVSRRAFWIFIGAASVVIPIIAVQLVLFARGDENAATVVGAILTAYLVGCLVLAHRLGLSAALRRAR